MKLLVKSMVVTLTICSAASLATAAPTHNIGDTNVDIGNPLVWNFNGLIGSQTTSGQVAMSFTAFENVTFNQLFNRIQVPGADGSESLLIEIQTDSGGVPSGTVVPNGSTTYTPTNGSAPVFTHIFSNPVSLTQNNVYHIVVRNDAVGADVAFNVFSSGADNLPRPYDYREDPAMQMHRDTGTGWASIARDPFFGFLFDDGLNVSGITGPGQPIAGTGISSSMTNTSTNGVTRGQTFTITDSVIPNGSGLALNTLELGMRRNGSLPTTLNVSIHELDALGNVLPALGTVTIDPNTVPDTGTNKIVFDFSTDGIVLMQGERYIITTDFGGLTDTGFLLYEAQAPFTGANADEMASNYGGSDENIAVRSNTFFTPYLTDDVFDLIFTLNGDVVIPEPGSVALLGLGSLLMLARRRRDA